MLMYNNRYQEVQSMSGINIFGHQALFEHVYKSAPIGIALVTIEGN